MFSLKLIVILAALICFGLAAVGVGTGRFNLIGAGLFLYVAAQSFG